MLIIEINAIIFLCAKYLQVVRLSIQHADH
jgi:hypothetical protein